MFSQKEAMDGVELTFDDDRDGSVLQQLRLLLELLLLPHIHELALQHVLPPASAVLILRRGYYTL